jgi:hypothetical protein
MAFIDFDAFHLAGRMGLQGNMGVAYDPVRMFAAEEAAGPPGCGCPGPTRRNSI